MNKAFMNVNHDVLRCRYTVAIGNLTSIDVVPYGLIAERLASKIIACNQNPEDYRFEFQSWDDLSKYERIFEGVATKKVTASVKANVSGSLPDPANAPVAALGESNRRIPDDWKETGRKNVKIGNDLEAF